MYLLLVYSTSTEVSSVFALLDGVLQLHVCSTDLLIHPGTIAYEPMIGNLGSGH